MTDLYTKKMTNRYEQIQYYTRPELERRWARLRQLMADKQLELIIMLDAYWEGEAQWVLGIENARECKYILVPKEGSVTAVFERAFFESGGAVDNALRPERTAWNRPMTPVHPAVAYAARLDMTDIKRCLGAKARPRIGIFNYGYMRADFRDFLLSGIPGAELVNVSADIHVIKSVKSEEELELIAEADKLNEKVLHAMPSIVRPGRCMAEVNADMNYMALELGSGMHLLHEVIFPEGMEGQPPLPMQMSPYPGLRLEPGMRLMCISETEGIGGMHTAIARPLIVDGVPSEESVRGWEAFKKAQDNAARMLQPGALLQDVYNDNYRFINELGYITNVQQYIHGIGYVYAERPYLHDREDCNTSFIPIQENMTFIVHPVMISRYYGNGTRTSIFGVDTFVVKPGGAVRTNRMPREIILT